MRRLARAAALCAALAGIAAAAEVYPSRPIMLVVPLATGGSTDTLARIMAEGMRVALGQPVIVENTTGAGGTIGVGRVARAAADGYTIGIGQTSTHVVNGAVYPLQYDLTKDFAPISLIATTPFLIVARKGVPANDLAGLIAWLKAAPEKVSQGTSGVGSPSHVAGIFFQKAISSRYQFVPYRSAGLQMQDLVGGQIDIMIDTPATSLPQVRAGTIKVYAVTANSRLAAAPYIPTVDEAGLPGLYLSFWHALFAPAGTPHDIVARLNDAVVSTLADPSVRRRFAELGQDIFPRERQTPEALAAYQKAEIEKWWPLIKAENIRAQ